jgi:hypothetical protein
MLVGEHLSRSVDGFYFTGTAENACESISATL